MDQPSPQSVVDFPPGFAPAMGTGAKFVAASPAPIAAMKRATPLHPTTVPSPVAADSPPKAQVVAAMSTKPAEAAPALDTSVAPKIMGGSPQAEPLRAPQGEQQPLSATETPNSSTAEPVTMPTPVVVAERETSSIERVAGGAQSLVANQKTDMSGPFSTATREHLRPLLSVIAAAHEPSRQALAGFAAVLITAMAFFARSRRQKSSQVSNPRDLASVAFGGTGLSNDEAWRQRIKASPGAAQAMPRRQFRSPAIPIPLLPIADSIANPLALHAHQPKKPMPGELAVRKHVQVNTHLSAAFAVFTQGHGRWWPLATHHMGPSTPTTAVLEPFVDGRWFERAVDGTEYEWGRVLVWEPPHRLILAWQVNYDGKQIAKHCTEVEILFIEEGPESTRVQLTHRHIDRYGEMGAKMHSIFDAENGWILVLQCFAGAATAWSAPLQGNGLRS